MSQFGSQFHGKSKRKLNGSGKKKLKNHDKRRHEMGGYFIATKLGEKDKVKQTRSRGGSIKNRMQYAAYANLLVNGKYKRVRIKSIAESKDNRNFARLNIITKGSVIDTDDGKAIVINRPGREGHINARKAE